MEIPDAVKAKMQKLIDNGFEVSLIGGAIRDYNLYKKPKDYDLFSNANGEQILKTFPKGKVIGNEERQKKILTVIVGDTEISQYRANGDRTKVGTSLDDHLKTCDFTINSICSNINGDIYDPNGGLEDLNQKIIRCVGNPKDRFDEDPLRILRAVRQKLQLGQAFSIEENTKEVMIEKIKNNELSKLAPERIQDELIKMVNHPWCFEYLFHYFILSKYLPECDAAAKQDGGKYHDEPVLSHMDFTFKESVKLTTNYRIPIACFLHDIGKPIEARIDDEGNVSFKGHQKTSVEIAKRFLTELKFSNADIKYITTMIKHHMMGDVTKMKDKTIIDIYNELEDAGISVEDMLIMTYSDNQGNQAKPRIKFNEFYQQNNWLRRVYKLKYQRMPFRIKDLEINGHDIIELGIADGKQIGAILNKIFELVMDGELKNDRPYLINHIKIMVNYIKQNGD